VPDESRIPVLVGVGQLRANRERTVDGAREPLALMARALEPAEGLSLVNLPPGALTHVGRTVRLSRRDGQAAVTVPAGDAA
jgi:hypothetical protein